MQILYGEQCAGIMTWRIVYQSWKWTFVGLERFAVSSSPPNTFGNFTSYRPENKVYVVMKLF